MDEWEPGRFGKGALVRAADGGEVLVLWRTDEHGRPTHAEGCAIVGVAYETVIAHLLVQPSGLCRSYEQDPARPGAVLAAELDTRLTSEPPRVELDLSGVDLDDLDFDEAFDDA